MENKMSFRGWTLRVWPIAVPVYRLSSAVSDFHSRSVLPDQVDRPFGKTELGWQSDTADESL